MIALVVVFILFHHLRRFSASLFLFQLLLKLMVISVVVVALAVSVSIVWSCDRCSRRCCCCCCHCCCTSCWPAAHYQPELELVACTPSCNNQLEWRLPWLFLDNSRPNSPYRSSGRQNVHFSSFPKIALWCSQIFNYGAFSAGYIWISARHSRFIFGVIGVAFDWPAASNDASHGLQSFTVKRCFFSRSVEEEEVPSDEEDEEKCL